MSHGGLGKSYWNSRPHLLLRGRADGERVPLEDGDLRNLDEDPVARSEVELGGLLDDEACDLGRQDQAGGDDRLAAVAGAHRDKPEVAALASVVGVDNVSP